MKRIKMRSKKEILTEYSKTPASWGNKFIVELLADLRDEQVSLNKTLSAVLAGLLMPAQQGGKKR